MSDTTTKFTQANYPAFPCEAQGDREVPPAHDHIQVGIYASKFPGVSKREYYAAKAMQGLCANQSMIDSGTVQEIDCTAEHAVLLAEALIAALAKSGAVA